MADLKLRLKVCLKGGGTVFRDGKIFEGTLDEFPKMIQTEYLEKNWNVIEVLTDAKGQEVPKKVKSVATNLQSTKVEPTSEKKPVDSSEGPKGRVRTDVSTVDSSTVATDADTKTKKQTDSKGESGTDDSDASSDTAQTESEKAAVKASPKAKPKLKPKAKPKVKPKAKPRLKKKS